MKRLKSVLAIALILTMMTWGSAYSLDAPVKIDAVQYDHPWGGDHQNQDFPLPVVDPKDPKPDIQKTSGFRSWVTNWFYNSILYLGFNPKSDITIEVIDNNSTDATNSNYTGTGK